MIAELSNDIQTLQWQRRRLDGELNDHKVKTTSEKQATSQLEQQEEQLRLRIAQLEDQKKIVQKNLKKKETDLYSLKFRIKDLQKTK